MTRDRERLERIQGALEAENYDAVVCALPSNVLLLSGYHPVIGTSVGIATSDGTIGLLVPEDELELAQQGWADEVHCFQPSSLEQLTSASAQIVAPLRELLTRLELTGAAIGYESGESVQPASYSALHLYGDTLLIALRGALPLATLRPADEMLAHLRAVKTPWEIDHIRLACQMVGTAFVAGAASLRGGILESQAAELFRQHLRTPPEAAEVARAEGFVWCMAGANSAQAAASYAHSRGNRISENDLVLVHCNSHVDGYWTDVTRTFCLREPDRQLRDIYEAVFSARAAALAEIQPGAVASRVDSAGREVLRAHGFATEFPHSTGHEVGFGAIDPGALPRIHPKSPDVLETGMVFNVEPAVYVDELGGVRQCEMVAVTPHGYELLTPFQGNLRELVLSTGQVKAA
jgi:Xaa-Pro aminopeptidase